MKPVLILCAVPAEAHLMERALQNRRDISLSGIRLVEGTLFQKQVWILVSGPGAVNAAAHLSAVLSQHVVSGIICVGCAGYYPETGLTIGDVALATVEIDLHLGLESPSPIPDPLPFPVLFQHAPAGRYETDQKLLKKAVDTVKGKTKGHRLATGPFVSVSTVTTSDATAHAIRKATCAVMENMEGAAFAHVARLFDCPFLEVRAASNRVGNRDRKSWDLETAFTHAGRTAIQLLSADLFSC